MQYPNLKKIFALIPDELFQELKRRDIFNSNFDRFVAEAISEKLKRAGEVMGDD